MAKNRVFLHVFRAMKLKFGYLVIFGFAVIISILYIINDPSFSEYKSIFAGVDSASSSSGMKIVSPNKKPEHLDVSTSDDLSVPASREPTRLYVLAYGRSGSTYTGQLFSSLNNTLYFFEPVSTYYTQRLHEKIMNVQQKYTKTIMDYLNGLFFCEDDAYGILKYSAKMPQWSKLNLTVDSCKNASMIVMKTVRLRFNQTINWMLQEPTVKVIFLIRDPRGIIASSPREWMDQKNPYHLCYDINQDLINFNKIPTHRRVLLRYEDLIENPIEKAKSVLKHLNIPWRPEIQSFVEAHYSDDPNAGSTTRPKDFSPDHKWKLIPQERRAQIESACKNVMMELNYKMEFN